VQALLERDKVPDIRFDWTKFKLKKRRSNRRFDESDEAEVFDEDTSTAVNGYSVPLVDLMRSYLFNNKRGSSKR
jgi:hypothetical protein